MGKRTFEECHKEALKYNSRTEFERGSNAIYQYSYRYGYMDQICSHMEYVYVLNRTFEECHKEALKYSSRSEFMERCNAIYDYSHRHGYMDQICSHMEYKLVYNRTFEDCQKEALKYSSRSEFMERSKDIYQYSYRNGYLDKICSHMTDGYVLNRTFEDCQKEALKYSSRSEFMERSKSIYLYSYRNGYLDKICGHMEYKYNPPNTVYFWKVLDEDIWKTGICYLDRLSIRLDEVAKSHNFQIQEYYYKQVDNCREMEKIFLSKGEKVNSLLECDGHTEFRTFDDYELNRILDYFND